MRRLLVNDRRVLAPTSRSFRSNLYRVVRGRFQALERRRQFRGLDDGGVGRVVVTRITPHWKVSYRSRIRGIGNSRSIFTFVSFNQIAVPAFGYRRVPTDAQFGTLHARDPHVAHQTGHACIRGHGNVHVFRLAGQRRDTVLGEHLESISGDRVQSGYRDLRVVENLLNEREHRSIPRSTHTHTHTREKEREKGRQKRTYGVGNVFDTHATSVADHPVSRIRPAAEHVRRVPREKHGGLVDEVHGQILRGRRWFYGKPRKKRLNDRNGSVNKKERK